MSVQVLQGDCIQVMRALKDNSVDSVVTDPPYGLAFMGAEWDSMPPPAKAGHRKGAILGNVPSGLGSTPENRVALYKKQGLNLYEFSLKWAAECLRVLKPGGHLLAFGGTRTYHRMVCAIEDAGFEIRDSMHWVYATGFPKSKNLDGQWKGWGTALKPAHEPIVVARKPLTGTVAANVLEWGTGGINVDGCRVETGDNLSGGAYAKDGTDRHDGTENWRYKHGGAGEYVQPAGRWPPNLLLSEEAAAEMDEQSGTLHARGNVTQTKTGQSTWFTTAGPDGVINPGDSGGASRYFPVFKYQAKAPAKERPKVDGISHPTCKPLGLMRWLVRLVTPPGGICLDLFAGSGTTGEACLDEGFNCILIEREPDYIKLIKERLGRREPTLWDSLWE